MTRLIDANVLLKQSRRVVEYDEAGFSMEYNAVPTEIIKNAPTVGAAQVVRGEWKIGSKPRCSVCGKAALREYDRDDWLSYVPSNFCPNCGADMRKKVE